MVVKFKKIRKANTVKKWNIEALSTDKRDAYIGEIEEKINCDAESSEELWGHIKTTVVNSAQEHLGYASKRTARKPWITQEMVDSMEERRKWKNVNNEEGRKMYKKFNNMLRRETDKAKQKWLEQQCEEIEELDKRGRSDLMYIRAKEMGKKYKASRSINNNIQDLQGNILKDKEKIKERWKEYFETLYDAANKPTTCNLEQENEVGEDDKGPLILLAETEASKHKLKKGKAPGLDNIPGELIECLGPQATKQLNKLDNAIYTTGKWPADFTRSKVVKLPKKANTKRCEEHRTLSLIPHCSKILLKTMYERIYSKVDSFIQKDQFGFRRKVGTREAIGTLRVLYEKAIHFGQSTYVCFVDYEKAFDKIDWQKMMKILKIIGLDWRERNAIWELYTNQSAVIQVGQEFTDPVTIGQGTRQGGILSTIVYNVYAQYVKDEALENSADGVKVNGTLIPSIRFADDKAMISNTNAGLQRIMDKLNETGRKYGMKINLKKTKIMRITHTTNKNIKITIDGKRIEAVEEFKYLGSMITDDGRCATEVKRRIAKAKSAFKDNEKFLSSNTNLELCKRLVKSIVWSNALYSAETWTLLKTDISRLEAFEMWCWRQMLNIKWQDRISNADVLNMANEERTLISVIRTRHKKWMGHIIRGDSLLKLAIEGRLAGKPKRGRRREEFLSYLKMGDSYENLKRRAGDRDEWRCWTPPI